MGKTGCERKYIVDENTVLTNPKIPKRGKGWCTNNNKKGKNLFTELSFSYFELTIRLIRLECTFKSKNPHVRTHNLLIISQELKPLH